jgi:hypothetical protein
LPGESAISALKIQFFDWFKATFLLVKAPFLFRFLIRSKGIPDPSAFNWPNYDLPTYTQKPPFCRKFSLNMNNHQSNSLLYSHHHILRISLQTPTCLDFLVIYAVDFGPFHRISVFFFHDITINIHKLVGLSPHVTC